MSEKKIKKNSLIKKGKDKEKPATVLIIDSDKFWSGVYQKKFEMEDYKVLMAEDGEKGLAMIRKDKPDLIISEIVLPKLNGFELVKKIKNNKSLSFIPIIFLTNLSYQDDVKKGLELGVNAFLIKAHCLSSEVLGKVRELLGRS